MSLTENQDFLDLLKASMEAMKMEPDYDKIVLAEPGWKTKPSELELRIRKEVMASLEDLLIRIENNNAVEHQACGAARLIKDRLNLLWGEQE